MTNNTIFPSLKRIGIFHVNLISIGIIAFGHSNLISGEKLITDKNGTTHSIKTYINGTPIHNKNEYFEIKSIHPAIDRMPGWKKNHLVWSIYATFLQDFQGTLKITSPLNNKIIHIASIEAKRSPRAGLVSTFRWQILDKEAVPEAWGWMNESGESWVPFRFQITSPSLSKSIEFLDWARITEKEKTDCKEDIATFESFEKYAEHKEIILQNGHSYQFKTNGNDPIRFSNNILQIDILSPGVIRNPEKNNNKTAIWVLKGHYRGNSNSTINISAPWIKSDLITQAKIAGNGEFTIQFAPRSSNPELWEWLNNDGEIWVPIHFQFQSKEIQYSAEFIELFHVDNELRANYIKMLNQ